MDNAKCLLLEFVNESYSLAVGFRSWLKHSLTDEELDEYKSEKKEVTISWPNCEIKSAKLMQKKIKTLKDEDWQILPARIIAHGDWIDMHNQLSSLEKFDKTDTSKKDRKHIMKRTSVAVCQDRITRSSNNTKAKDQRKITSQNRSKDILQQIKNAEDTLSYEGVWSTSRSNETDEESSSDAEPLLKKTKTQLAAEIAILKLDKKNLNETVQELTAKVQQNVISYSTSLSEIDDKVSKIISKLTDIDNIVTAEHCRNVSRPINLILCPPLNKNLLHRRKSSCRRVQVAALHETSSNLEEIFCDESTKIHPSININQETPKPKEKNADKDDQFSDGNFGMDSVLDVSDETGIDSTYELARNTNFYYSSPPLEHGDSSASKCRTDKVPSTSNLKPQNPVLPTGLKNKVKNHEAKCEPQLMSSGKKGDLKSSTTSTEPSRPPLELLDNGNVVDLGHGVTIKEDVLKLCRHQVFSKLVNNLMSALFSEAELAHSSRTGKKAKPAEVLNGEADNKKRPLDPNRLQAIKDYAIKIHGDTVENQKSFRTTVTNKCKNTAKSFKGKENV